MHTTSRAVFACCVKNPDACHANLLQMCGSVRGVRNAHQCTRLQCAHTLCMSNWQKLLQSSTLSFHLRFNELLKLTIHCKHIMRNKTSSLTGAQGRMEQVPVLQWKNPIISKCSSCQTGQPFLQDCISLLMLVMQNCCKI